MSDFETVIRKDDIDGLTDWVWPKEDTGLWHGPSMEWRPISEMVNEHCKSKHTVVQAGGACGMYPRLYAQMFKSVFTFEPDPYNFYCLAQNCQDMKIHKFNAVLGDRHRNITFHQPSESNRGDGTCAVHMTKTNDDIGGNTPMLRIDDFVYEKLDLIHLDVEGSEQYVIYGARISIRMHHPLIILETVNGGIEDLLKDEGYITVGRAGTDTVFKHQSLI
jgi:FkbM family methyltransferase